MSRLPEVGFVRLPQIIGQSEVTSEQAALNRSDAAKERARGEEPNVRPKRARPAIPPLVPISKSKWWAGVASGKYPRPMKSLGPRVTAWRVEDVRALIQQVTVRRA
jgi:predicted DNA-binding transcriptional regulator AlpA